MITDMYNLYIPATAVGVSDDLIIIDEIETDRMLIKSNIYGWSGNDDCFIFFTCKSSRMFYPIVCAQDCIDNLKI